MKYRGALFLLFMLLLSRPVQAIEITWMRTEFPPYWMQKTLNGPMENIERRIQITTLAGFQHRFEYVTHKRRQESVAKLSLHCTSGIQKTAEREKTMIFSAPYIAPVETIFITSRDKLGLFRPYIQSDGRLNLDNLLNSSGERLTMGLSLGLKFSGDLVNDFVRESRDFDRFGSTEQSSLNRILKMLTRDRIDFTFSFDSELAWMKRQEPGFRNLEEIRLAGDPGLITNWMACHRDPDGEQVITGINRFLLRHRFDPHFMSGYTHWINVTDEDVRRVREALQGLAFVGN